MKKFTPLLQRKLYTYLPIYLTEFSQTISGWIEEVSAPQRPLGAVPLTLLGKNALHLANHRLLGHDERSLYLGGSRFSA